MTLTVACISNDIDYATKMMSYMKSNPIYRTWRLQLYTSVSKYMENIAMQAHNILLVEEAMLTIEPILHEVIQNGLIWNADRSSFTTVIVLAGQADNAQQYLQLRKYQPLSSLLHAIQTALDSDRHHMKHVKKERCTVVTIGSSLSFCGKTTYSLHLAHLLAMNQSKVFYLNLERMNSSTQWLASKATVSGSYSDLLYMQKSNSPEVDEWFRTHRQFDPRWQIEFLQPFAHKEDRSMLQAQDASCLLQGIMDSALYDYIIVDLEAGYDTWNEVLVQQGNVHFMLLLGNEQWIYKHVAYMEELKEKQKQLANILERQSIPIWTGEPVRKDMKTSIKLPFIEQWNVQLPELLTAPQYRAAVEHCIHTTLMNKTAAS